MRRIPILGMFFTVCSFFMNGSCENAQVYLKEKYFQRELEYSKQLNVLDSVVRNSPDDTSYYCCSYSIDALERISGIDGSSDGTALGKLSFTKGDYLKWKDWYMKKKKRN